MYKFVKIKDENNEFDKTNVTVTIPFNDIILDDLCEAFTDFIKACGFFIDNKKAAIVSYEENDQENSNDNITAISLTDEDIIKMALKSEDDLIEEQSQPEENN